MLSNKVVFPITLCGDEEDFEVSAYSPPRALNYELQMVFPNLDLEKEKLIQTKIMIGPIKDGTFQRFLFIRLCKFYIKKMR